jgi:hypothetical protein
MVTVKRQVLLLLKYKGRLPNRYQPDCNTACYSHQTWLPAQLPCAEEHRELVRRSLRAILAAGYSPMSFFARDHAKYFYLAELLSLVDLSLVSIDPGTAAVPAAAAPAAAVLLPLLLPSCLLRSCHRARYSCDAALMGSLSWCACRHAALGQGR